MSDDGYEMPQGEQMGGGGRGEHVSSGGTVIDLTDIFGALANERRRLALYYLQDHNPADLDQLAVQVATWEQGMAADDLGAKTRESVLLDLYHCHLPKLAAVGIVEYDRQTRKLRYREQPAYLAELLERTADIELPDD